MLKRAMIASGLLAALMIVTARSAEEEKVKPKCPLSGKAINEEALVSHNGGDVYFCCGNCVKAFKADPEKHAAKANHQLVVTGQAKQKACPFSGGKLNEEAFVKVEGVKVTFCCERCQGKVKESEEQVNLVFTDKAFKKGFEIAKKEDK